MAPAAEELSSVSAFMVMKCHLKDGDVDPSTIGVRVCELPTLFAPAALPPAVPFPH